MKYAKIILLTLTLINSFNVKINVNDNDGFKYVNYAFAEETGKRKALVIGNENYTNVGELSNPINDTIAIEKKLSELNFSTKRFNDLKTKRAMRDKISEFIDSVNENDTVLFYYSGHGIQVDNQNYLIPTDASVKNKADIEEDTIKLEYIIEALKEKPKFLFVIVDACRDNPFNSITKSLRTKGLSVVRGDILQDKQVVVLFATSPDNKAIDSHPKKSNIGLFAGEFVDVIGIQNKTSESMFKELTKRVKQVSNNTQVPWLQAPQLTEDFYFNQVASVNSNPTREPLRPSMSVSDTYGGLEISVKSSGTLYIDDVKMGSIKEGNKAILDNIAVGNRKVVMDYSDKKEEKIVFVNENSRLSIKFDYRKSIPAITSVIPQVEDGFVYVQGGTFQMGNTNDGGLNSKPIHSVMVNSFYIGKYEVTQKEYQSVMGNNPSKIKEDSLPVEQISFDDAIAFCNKYNQMKGLPNAYDSNGNIINFKSYRLPTEAEWEFAARGGNKSNDYKYSGSDNPDEVAWYTSNTNDKGSKVVGTKKPNELGIYDMSGNIWEWVSDWYDRDYYSKSPSNNPYNNVSSSDRVNRGGGWYGNTYDLRVTKRSYESPSFREESLGFRLLRSE